MKEQMLSILNENSAELTVEKAKKIQQAINKSKGVIEDDYHLRAASFLILESFESFKKIRLEKGQFVCEVEKPAISAWSEIEVNEEALDTTKAYELALQKVIFAGFEKGEHHKDVAFHNSDMLSIQFALLGVVYFTIMDKQTYLTNPTIGDLETEIERYNRTASEPIQLKFTENILPLLGVKI